jgi:hypothetical protein
MTQGRFLIGRLKRKPHTYLEMLRYGVSTAPWKRCAESLRNGERIIKGRNKRGLVTWAVRA